MFDLWIDIWVLINNSRLKDFGVKSVADLPFKGEIYSLNLDCYVKLDHTII